MTRAAAAFEPLRPRRVTEERSREAAAETSGMPATSDAPRHAGSATELETRPAASPQPGMGAEQAASEPCVDEEIKPGADEFAQERFEGAVREEAIRFATIAVARALRVAVRDPNGVMRYVDDALLACGRQIHARVRLHPADAQTYRPQRNVRVAPDMDLARGEIAIDVAGGEIAATIEERAELLVRAACA